MVIAKYLNFIKNNVSKLKFPFLYKIAKYLMIVSDEHLIIMIMNNCENTCSIINVKGNRFKTLQKQAKYWIILQNNINYCVPLDPRPRLII